MITVETAQDFLQRGYGLAGHCNVCRRSAQVDLTALRGGVVLAGEPRAALRCTDCGSRDTTRIVVSPTWWSGSAFQQANRS